MNFVKIGISVVSSFIALFIWNVLHKKPIKWQELSKNLIQIHSTMPNSSRTWPQDHDPTKCAENGYSSSHFAMHH